MPPLIDVQTLTVSYGDPPRTILHNIDLTVEEGEFVCVLGQTGCGKSTLLRLILGAEQPTQGRILIDGVEHPRPDRVRGYVPQKYALFPDRTVLDNITFGLEVSEFNLFTRWTPRYFTRRRQFRAEALEYLENLGLRSSDASKYPDELSGGMQQRVAIAQALINRPRILLMDEAFSALDPATRRETQTLMKKLWKDNRFTALFVTHNTREALLLGSRVIVLAKDHADSPSEIVLDERVPQNWRDEEDTWIGRLEKASTGDAVGAGVPVPSTAAAFSEQRLECSGRRLAYPASFSKLRPSGSGPTSLNSGKLRSMTEPVIVVDPEIMNGMPCFRGTRVPFKNLIDYLEAGHSLGDFLRQFPTVSREMAIQALEEAKDSLFARIG